MAVAIISQSEVVYVIRNTVDGKRYVGSTGNFKIRRQHHLSKLRHNKHHAPALQAAFNKHGESAFAFEIVESCHNSRVREQHYLDTLKPEYNVALRAGGKFRLGLKNSPEHCARISAGNMGRVGTNLGKRFTKEHRRKMSIAAAKQTRRVGWHHTQEARDKMSRAQQKRTYKPRSKASLRKASRSHLRNWANRTPERRAEIAKKISDTKRAQVPARTTKCVMCETAITYQSNGEQIPKTCGEVCLRSRRRQLASERAAKARSTQTHCKHGHLWSVNAVKTKQSRYCRTCAHERRKAQPQLPRIQENYEQPNLYATSTRGNDRQQADHRR